MACRAQCTREKNRCQCVKGNLHIFVEFVLRLNVRETGWLCVRLRGNMGWLWRYVNLRDPPSIHRFLILLSAHAQAVAIDLLKWHMKQYST